jgi:hypothetical protein
MNILFLEWKCRNVRDGALSKGAIIVKLQSRLLVASASKRLLTPIILVGVDIHQIPSGIPAAHLIHSIQPSVQVPSTCRSLCGVFSPGISKFICHLRRKCICQAGFLPPQCQTFAFRCRFGRDAQPWSSGLRWRTSGYRRRGIERGAAGGRGI